MEIENYTLKQLLWNQNITNEEYKLLFSDKSNWDSENQNNHEAGAFWEIFSRIKHTLSEKNIRGTLKLSPHDSLYNFSYINFPDMGSSSFYENYIVYDNYENDGDEYIQDTDFSYCIFCGKANFSNAIFSNAVKFKNVIFKQEALFDNATFKKETLFKNSLFQNEVIFKGARFNDWVSFKKIKTKKNLNFTYCKSNDIIDFSDSELYSIDLEHSRISELGYLSVKSNNHSIITQNNFKNKETARIIKSHFEKQNNITEANKYFAIEQKLYLDELQKDGLWKNKGNIFAVGLHQLISNSGTSWLRVLASIILFTLLVFLGYEYINEFIHIKEGFSSSVNTAIQLIDPLGMFSADNDIYEEHQAIGFVIRIITIYLFYQFIMAFRNNTRRK